MPYIKQDMRKKIDPKLDALMHAVDEATDDTQVDGALNYVVTRILKHFYTDGTDAGGIPLTNYFKLNRSVGLLGCIKTEWERRVVGLYETTKIYENGDVE